MLKLKKYRILAIPLFMLSLPFLLSACGLMGENKNPTAPITPGNTISQLPDSTGPGLRQDQKRAFPNYCFYISVPWISQLPPGTDWSKTNNCGQAIGVMLGAKFNGGYLAPWVIDDENRWLGCSTPYGCQTGASTLQWLLKGYHALNSTKYIGNYADDVVMEGAHGRPVIVGVRTGMSGPGVGRPHWMLFVGWDGTYMYFNDPGRSEEQNGRCKYTVAQFMTSWNDQGRVYIPVYK